MTIRIDFQRVALNIRKQGISLEAASRKLGRHRSWLGHVSRGEVASVEFHDGLALLDYHLEVCGLETHQKLLEH